VSRVNLCNNCSAAFVLVADLRGRRASAAAPEERKPAQAIRYGLSHWDDLNRFLDDGRIEIDSNTVERSIPPVVATACERCGFEDRIA
jgi:hypothetical protein